MKIICFDLDGTILNRNEEIHPEDQKLLKTCSEMVFIITTGRALPSIRGVFQHNHLFTEVKIPFPIVAQNGAVLYQSNEKIIDWHTFEKHTQIELINTIRNFPDITFYLFDSRQIYVMHKNPTGSYYAEMWYMPLKPYFHNKNYSFTKIMGLSKNIQNLRDAESSVSKLPLEVSYSLEFLLEITPMGIDKGNGLNKLLKELKISNPEIYVAGDGGNDLPIFRNAFRTYCPNSSSPTVLNRADVIINREKSGILSPMLKDAGLLPR